jgi:hypothetical protein
MHDKGVGLERRLYVSVHYVCELYFIAPGVLHDVLNAI